MSAHNISEPDCSDSEFVEIDPTGRYGRYDEILGKGSSKTVYKAFDEYEGIEVAWNQVKLYDFLQSPEDLERLYCEIHLLKTLKHKNIMKFYTSWVDTSKRNLNFVTEMFTSGTLRQYRQKHKRVDIRAVKHWCRQILNGLLYLHSHDPHIIHRDLKCDNIFINGNQGEVKIGDLGLAAILRKSHADHCVGTPEFMAPEIYEEQYNELVDIYSFGMCILEMVTFDYPYSECTHPAQIYKKVTSGMKPDALYKVDDPEVRRFVEKCLVTVSQRLSAKELLNDPFLQINDSRCHSMEDNSGEFNLVMMTPGQPDVEPSNGFFNGPFTEFDMGCGLELFDNPDDEFFPAESVTIEGKRRQDGEIFMRLRISDNEGRVRKIHFRFDIESDTALSVVTEMVGLLDLLDHDVTNIAEMIDEEISKLVPCWKKLELLDGNQEQSISLLPSPQRCSTSTHGRFEEVTTYKFDGVQPFVKKHNGSICCGSSLSEQCFDSIGQVGYQQPPPELPDDYENEIRHELRWLKDKYQTELMEHFAEKRPSSPSHHENVATPPPSLISPQPGPSSTNDKFVKSMHFGMWLSSHLVCENRELGVTATASDNTSSDFNDGIYMSNSDNCRNDMLNSNGSLDDMSSAKKLYSGVLLNNCISQAKSLPVDAVEF